MEEYLMPNKFVTFLLAFAVIAYAVLIIVRFAYYEQEETLTVNVYAVDDATAAYLRTLPKGY